MGPASSKSFIEPSLNKCINPATEFKALPYYQLLKCEKKNSVYAQAIFF